MSLGAIPKRGKKKVIPRHLIDSDRKASSLDSVKRSQVDSSASQSGMTSTPAPKGSAFHSFDASVVTDSLPLSGERMGVPPKPVSVTKREIGSESFENVFLSPSPPKDEALDDSFDEEIAEMDLLYAEYLQAAFLESEAKLAFERRFTKAVDDICKMLASFLDYVEEVKKVKGLITVEAFVVQVQEHCEKQDDILKPVFEILPTLQRQYESVAEAVNKTKHKLPEENVELPDPHETLNALQKIKEFITSFLDAVPSNRNTVVSSDKLQKFSDAAELLKDALHKGVQLLKDTHGLRLSKACLTLGPEDLCSERI